MVAALDHLSRDGRPHNCRPRRAQARTGLRLGVDGRPQARRVRSDPDLPRALGRRQRLGERGMAEEKKDTEQQKKPARKPASRKKSAATNTAAGSTASSGGGSRAPKPAENPKKETATRGKGAAEATSKTADEGASKTSTARKPAAKKA